MPQTRDSHRGDPQRGDSRSASGRSGFGLRIAPRFAIATTLALAVVLIVFAFVLLGATRNIVEKSVSEAQAAAAVATLQQRKGLLDYEQQGSKAARVAEGLMKFPVVFKGADRGGQLGTAFVGSEEEHALALLTPREFSSEDPIRTLYTLFFTLTAVALIVTAVVALAVASRVSRPISTLVDDVRTIANGHLEHRCRARVGGEVGLLAGAIDRMTTSLRDAQDVEVELSVREREREVALEVQSALRSSEIAAPPGYSVASEHVSSDDPAGDFHAFVNAQDGRTVYVVCDVSGKGVPGALVGAMTRAYLRSAFERGGSLAETLKSVNRTLAGEIRKGMYATVLAAALDPESGELEVACAGHKLPLVHWSAADEKVRALSPDGIALGFDKGPVFDRSISSKRLTLVKGDRVLLAGTGAVGVVGADGEEFGEKRLYKLFARNAQAHPKDVLDGILTALDAFAGENGFPADVSVIVLGRG